MERDDGAVRHEKAERDDWADRHVARWQDHWSGIRFDEDVEAITVRLARIVKYFERTTKASIADVGLQDFEYQTLHVLMIRDTPGHASPSELAKDLEISPAGMTGRLDGMEEAGWLRRTTSVSDRRRVDVEITKAGLEVWQRAMDLRGSYEDELLGVLTRGERRTLATLLKRLTLSIEDET